MVCDWGYLVLPAWRHFPLQYLLIVDMLFNLQSNNLGNWTFDWASSIPRICQISHVLLLHFYISVVYLIPQSFRISVFLLSGMGLSCWILLSSDPTFCWSMLVNIGQLTGIVGLSRPQPNSCERTIGWWFWRVILILEDPSCASQIGSNWHSQWWSANWESPFTTISKRFFPVLPLGSFQCGTEFHGRFLSKSHVGRR